MSDFYESVEGLDDDGSIARAWRAAGGSGERRRFVARLTGLVVERIRQTKRLTKHEVDFLDATQPRRRQDDAAQRQPVSGHRLPEGLSERAYPTYSDFLWDVVPIIRSEIHALVARA